MSESLAIVGISCLFPKADDLQAYWRNIKNGVDAITPIPATHWSAADYFHPDPKSPDRTYAQRGGFLSPVEFNPMEFGIAPKDVEATDTTQLLGMVGAKQALIDAGYGDKPFNRARTSVILGVTGAMELVIPLGARLGHPIWRRALQEAGVEETVAEDVVRRISDSYVGWQENSFPGLLGNVVAGRIASRFDLGGTNCVVDAACASSMAAIHLAALELSSGRSDMVITGGIDTFNDIFMYVCFSKTPALSPAGDAKPFDRDCDGTILGEGLGMLVLKRLTDAERDGDRVYAVIRGIGTSSDGRGSAIYAPRADGQKEALRRAYAEAEVTPDTIELIEAHGTGTKVGDATEIGSLTEVYRAARPVGTWVALGSVKSQIGHTKAAAGVAGLIKAALALHHQVLPPTIKVTQPVDEAAPGRSPFYVNTRKRPWLPRANHPRRAGVSAFGFGGTNFHCVLEERDGRRQQPAWDGDVEIFAFSAERREELRAQVAGLAGEGSWTALRSQAARTRQEFRRDAAFRLLLPLVQGTSLVTLRDAALKMLDQQGGKPTWVLPNGTAFGSGAQPGRLGALFPGQGSQYVGMLADLACQFPGLIEALTLADGIFGAERPDLGSQRLSDFIHPHPAFSDEVRREQEAALKSTDVAQPALGAVGLGALSVLAYFGVKPGAAAGHSYGELLALCGAGRLQPEALHRLSNVRGRLMANRNGHSDRGAMLAVQAPEEAVTRFLADTGSSLVIANRNSPQQFVLAGSKAEIERAAAELAKRSLRAKVLPVSAAFHSALVADAQAPFATALADVEFSGGQIPVYANSTARTYPGGAAQAREVLAGQIVQPVDFMAQIETMIADGVTTFIETGPGHVLTDLVQAIAQGRDVDAVALDSSRGSRSGTFDLAVALCRLAALGHAVELSRWEEPVPAPKASANGKPGFTLALTGANQRSPSSKRPPMPSTPAPAGQAYVPPVALPVREPAPVQRPSLTPSIAGPSAIPALGASAGMSAALQVAQQGMLALQKMQEETARLHRQFLEGQDAARRTLESLLAQRRELLHPPAGTGSRLPSSPSALADTEPSRGFESRLAPQTESSTPATPAAKESAPQTPPGIESTEVARAVLDVVAEKTGYPAEMLNLEMGLDSDLGIDSIKRVEIMAALRGRLPEAREIKPEHLGTLQTLQQVVDFLAAGGRSAAPVCLTVMETVVPTAQGATAGTAVEVVRASAALLQVVAEKTGYPADMLNLDMGLDSDLGIDSIKRVEIMAALRSLLPEAPEIKPEHLGTLQTLQQVVDFLTRATPSAGTTRAASGPASTPVKPAVIAEGTVDFAQASEALLQVVAEKTGYPVDMLNLDMGLDSDLGVDSIKRVEIMAALRSLLPAAPEIKPEHLGTLQTLRQVVEFLTNLPAASAKGVAEVVARSSPPMPEAPSIERLHRQVVKAIRLNESEARPLVSLPRGSRIWVTEDGSPLAEGLAARLGSLGYSVRRSPVAELLDHSGDDAPAGLVILWPSARGDDSTLRQAFRLMQRAAASLRKARGLLVTASRLDGAFGFGSLNGKGDPTSGGLAGLAKTAAREWPEVACKAIDLNPEAGIGDEVAAWLVDEMFRVGPVEVGLSATGRLALQLDTVPQVGTDLRPVFEPDDVVIVSGGARGITAAVAGQLAREHRLHLVLLGRSPLDEAEPAWMAAIEDEAELKRALVKRARGGESPKRIETRLRETLAQREIRQGLQQLRDAGSTALYRPVDVRHAGEVEKVCDEIRRQLGPIRGLIHGAGVLADRKIENKTAEQFELVYGTKVVGLRNLLKAVEADDLKLLALFSSYSGRFGRVGQVDYAAANEVLNKLAQSVSRQRPRCRVVSFNWGPWNGGMVSDGLRKIFANEGVGLIEPRLGAEFFVREISSPEPGPVEVLALVTLPVPSGNGVPDAPSTSGLNVAFEREVSVEALPCLASHVLNGRAVVPAALIVEWLAHGAVHDHPGMAFHGFDQFQVLKGLILEPGASILVSVLAGAARRRNGLQRVPVQLISRSGNRQVVHARAEVLLAEILPAAPVPAAWLSASAEGNGYHSLYGDGPLFHGPHFHGIEKLETCSATGMSAVLKCAPAPKHWIRNPLRSVWLTEPLALDSSFQMMILWSWEHHQAGSLPCAIRSFRQFASAFPQGGSRVVIQITEAAPPMITAELQFLDRQGRVLAVAEGCEFAMDPALREAFRQNQLPHGA
ncbi:MAG: SDR family NAD(P)-dependent oxidoreductase [Limisphaerales bacterium]